MSLTAVGTEFTRCTATQEGGAVYHNGSGKNAFTNCTFDSCESQTNGGGAYITGAKLEMSGTTFQNCRAVSSGGGLYISTVNGSTLENSTFANNWVTASDSKGGSR